MFALRGPGVHVLTVPLSNGQWCHRRVHPEWEQDLQVKERVWDLSKAYRQLARNPSHARFTVVATWGAWNCTSSARFWRSSVPHFCWVAGALWRVPSVLASVPWTHFVDDYPTSMYHRLCGSLEVLVEGFFSVVGFKFKDQPSFSNVLSALGFTFPSDRAVVVVLRSLFSLWRSYRGIVAAVHGHGPPKVRVWPSLRVCLLQTY